MLFLFPVFSCVQPFQDRGPAAFLIRQERIQDFHGLPCAYTMQNFFQKIPVLPTLRAFRVNKAQQQHLSLQGDHAVVQPLVAAVVIKDANQVENRFHAFFRTAGRPVIADLFLDEGRHEFTVAPFHGEADCRGLQNVSHLLNLFHVMRIQGNNRGADVGLQGDQALLLKPVQRFAQRRAADAKVCLDLVDVDPASERYPEKQDLFPQFGINLIHQRLFPDFFHRRAPAIKCEDFIFYKIYIYYSKFA